jgi:hypothetical protein
MELKSEWFEKTRMCSTPEELRQVLFEDLAHCVMEVAKGRAFFNLLEKMYPFVQPKNDPALVKLRLYAVEGHWRWSSEGAMARDLAELVEDMEAVKQRGDALLLEYRAALHDLVADKLCMDRGAAILGAFDSADSAERGELFLELREATLLGWAEGLKKVQQESKDFLGDPLIRYKSVANAELGRKRFVKTAASNRA